jgi:hypothetical protein
MLGHYPDALSPREVGDYSYRAYLAVDDVDAIILSRPECKPWGMREIAVATPDGHRIMLGQSV